MTFTVSILGTSSATPTKSRFTTAQVVNVNEQLYLIDCGEGTQIQLRKYRIRIQRIACIFVSHLHGDHFFGLVGLISTMHLLGRKTPLNVYGPEGLEKIVRLQLDLSDTHLNYTLHFHSIDPDTHTLLYENKVMQVEAFPLNHGIPTTGFLFREKPRPRKILKERVQGLPLSVPDFNQLKMGKDVHLPDGTIYKNTALTTDPPPPLVYAYCSDTSYFEAVVPFIRKANLLYHEATFCSALEKVANEKFHSTAAQAATIAKLADVGKLLIGHYSARYDELQPLLDEAKAIFPHTELGLDGLKVKVEHLI